MKPDSLIQPGRLTILLLLLLAGLKFYSQVSTSRFEADQEYLALSSRAILRGDLTLIGAPTSIGGMFVGPLYTYVSAGLMWLFAGNPYTIAAVSATWAIITIPGIYVVGRKLFSHQIGFLAAIIALGSAAFLNADEIPPLLFPLPLLTLGLLWVTNQSWSVTKRALLAGMLIGLALHLHFSGIFLLPLVVALGPVSLISILVSLAPLVIFDLRHNWFITQHAWAFLTSPSAAASPWSYRLDSILRSFASLLSPSGGSWWIKLAVCLIILLAVVRIRKPWLLAVLGLPIILTFLYQGALIPYYLLIGWVPFILALGWAASWLRQRGFIGQIGLPVAIGVFILINMLELSHRYLGRSLDKKMAALRYIQTHSGGQPIYLSMTMDSAANFGFSYLTDYIGLPQLASPTEPTYTLIAPYNYENIRPDILFGDFGVILPRPIAASE